MSRFYKPVTGRIRQGRLITGLVQAQYEYADKITGLAQARINLQSFQGIQQASKLSY